MHVGRTRFLTAVAVVASFSPCRSRQVVGGERPRSVPLLTTEKLADAIHKSKTLGQTMVLYVSSSDCGVCEHVESVALAQVPVIEELKNCAVFKVEAGTDLGRHVRDRYHVHEYPTFIVSDRHGLEVDRIEGFGDVDTFLSRLRDILQGRDTLPDLRRRARTGSQEAISRLVDKLVRAAPLEAVGVIDGLIRGHEQEPSAADLLARRGMANARADRTEAATQDFRSVLANWPTSAAAEAVIAEGLLELRRGTPEAVLPFLRSVANESKDVATVEQAETVQLLVLLNQTGRVLAGRGARALQAQDWGGLAAAAEECFQWRVNFAEAKVWLERTIREDGRKPSYLHALASLLAEDAGNLERAIQLAEEALGTGNGRPRVKLEADLAKWRTLRRAEDTRRAR